MKEKDVRHYTESVLYATEQAVVYFRVKSAQIFNSLDKGITSDQFAALDAIYCNKDGICQRDLSKIILKDRSNTGRIVTILERNGFITRAVESKGNRPVKNIYISDKGRKLIDEMMPVLKKAFMHVFEEFSDEEFDMLRILSTKLKKCLSKTTYIQI